MPPWLALRNEPPARERLALRDTAATDRLGQVIAERLEKGDVVLLRGDLGAGKTALARAMIRTLLGDPALEVPSPSFALLQPYEARNRAILHVDLYRLGREADIAELGLLDEREAIVLVEWPERAPTLEALARLTVTLSIPADGVGRMAELRWHGEGGKREAGQG